MRNIGELGEEIFVVGYGFDYIVVGGEAGLAYGHTRLKIGVLGEATYTNVAAVGDSATVLRFAPCE